MLHTYKNCPPREKIVFDRQYPIYLDDTIGVNTRYQVLHYHDALEINMIKSGTGYYMINGNRYEFEPGDILIINSNDLHCAYETRDLVMQVITFDAGWFMGNLRYDPQLLSPFQEIGLHFTNLLDRNHPEMPHMRWLLQQMQQEHRQQLPSVASMVYVYMIQFFVHLNRHFRQLDLRKPEDAVSAVQLDKVRYVLSTLDERYAYPWTLKELSALVYLSPSRFSSLFSRTVGMSPISYLTHLRLEKVCDRLGETDEKIVEIAMECGFRSLSNFNRLFKRHMGMKPKDLRKGQSTYSKIVPVFERFGGDELEIE